MNELIIRRKTGDSATSSWHGLFRVMLMLIVVFAALAFAGCRLTGPDAAPDMLVIGSWNVQALFDGKDDGGEYDEYREAALWNEKKYQARLIALSGAIQCMGGSAKLQKGEGFPDVMALIEIENLQVLEDLAAMPGMSYGWLFFANAAGAGLGTGVLSRFPIRDARTHAVTVSGTEAPRPVAEVWLELEGRENLVLMVCHWKSKLGGEKATESARRAAAMVISRRLEEIENSFPGTPVIILGDLNENHDEVLRVGGAYTTALLGDYSEVAEYVSDTGTVLADLGVRPGVRDFLVLSGNKPPRAEYAAGPALFSPWMEREKYGYIIEENSLKSGDFREESLTDLTSVHGSAADGSYYYKDQWETIDHFLLNGSLFDGAGWEYRSFGTPNMAPFTKGSAEAESGGFPDTFNPRTGTGLADHLPVLLGLVWN
jgi:hypothetical protein